MTSIPDGINRRALLGMLASAAMVSAGPVLANGRRSRPKSSTPTASRKGRVAAMSERNGGHMHKHIARPPSYLKGRVATGQARKVFQAGAAGADLRRGGKDRALISRAPTSRETAKVLSRANGKEILKRVKNLRKVNLKPRHVSTFASGRAADTAWQQAVRANRTKIKAFLRDPARTRMTLPFGGNAVIGSVYRQGAKGSATGRLTPATSGYFVVQKTGLTGSAARKAANYYPLSASLYASAR